MKINNIYNIDCAEALAQMQPESVDLVVTSPPYDNLRNYGNIQTWNVQYKCPIPTSKNTPKMAKEIDFKQGKMQNLKRGLYRRRNASVYDIVNNKILIP